MLGISPLKQFSSQDSVESVHSTSSPVPFPSKALRTTLPFTSSRQPSLRGMFAKQSPSKDSAESRPTRPSLRPSMKKSEKSFFHRESFFFRDVPAVRYGISYQGIEEFIGNCGGWSALQGLSTREVVEKFVKPMCSASCLPYCDMVNKSTASTTLVGEPRVALIHCWQYNFLEVVTQLRQEMSDELDNFVWFDVFSCNQHSHTHDAKSISKHTKSIMSSVDRVLVMWLSPWRSLTPFKRSWCLYEMYCAEESGVPAIDIGMSPESLADFLPQVAGSYEEFKSLLRRIDIRYSNTTVSSDRDAIFSLVDKKTELTVKCNLSVHAILRRWLIKQIDSTMMSNEDSRLRFGFVLAILQHDVVCPPTAVESEVSEQDEQGSVNGSSPLKMRPNLTSRLSVRVLQLFKGKAQAQLFSGHAEEDLPLDGLTMAAVNEFIRDCCDISLLAGLSAASVSETFLRPMTSEFRSSYCEVLRMTRRKGVDVANTWVVISADDPFIQVASLLSRNFGEGVCSNAVLWMPLFSLSLYDDNHWDLSWLCEHTETAAKERRLTALVLLQWENPLPLNALCEVYFGLAAGKPFELVMDKTKRYNFLFAIAMNESVLNYLLINIYLEETTLSGLGGNIDISSFKSIIKEGILNAMALFYEYALSSYEVDEQVRITDALGILYRRIGSQEKADGFYKTSLLKRRESLKRGVSMTSEETMSHMYQTQQRLDAIEESSDTRFIIAPVTHESSEPVAGELTDVEDSPFSFQESIGASLSRMSTKLSKGLRRLVLTNKSKMHVEESEPFPHDGLSISAISAFVADIGRANLEGLSVDEVTTKFVKEKTMDFETSYCEVQRWQSGGTRRADVFVGYSPQENFLTMIELLEKSSASQGDVALWLSMFSLNLGDDEHRNFSWMCRLLNASVKGMRLMVLVHTDWERPIPLRCLFKVYFFLLAGKPLEIAMDNDKHLDFLMAVASNSNAMNNLVSNVMVDTVSWGEDGEAESAWDGLVLEHIKANWDLTVFAATIQKAILKWLLTKMETSLHSYDKRNQLRIIELLARVYLNDKIFDKAETLYTECLRLQRSLLGPNNVHSLGTLYVLGCLYRDVGQFDKAKEVFQDLLDRRTSVQGRKHADTLTAMQALASECRRLSLDEQVPLYEECFLLRREVLGKDHVETVATMEKLAEIYYSKEMYDKADDLYAVLFEKRRAQLGIDHRATLSVMSTLADVYFRQEKFEKAEYLYTIVLEKKETSLGLDHSETLMTMVALAELHFKLGTHSKSQQLFRIALEKMKDTFGKDHPKTLSTMVRLGDVYMEMGVLDTAETLFAYCYNNSLMTVGKAHTDTLAAMLRLAQVHVAQSQYGKAEEMFKFCLKCRKETLGIDHDDTVTLMYSLGDIYIAQGAFDKAEVLYDDFWNNVKGMNPNSLKTLASMSVLADLYFKRGDMHKAELFYTLVLDRRRQLLGDFNNETLSSMCGLASVYNTKGDYVRAEKLFKECAEKRVALLGPTHEATLAIFGILAKFYQERGEYESAEKYFDLLYAAKTPIY